MGWFPPTLFVDFTERYPKILLAPSFHLDGAFVDEDGAVDDRQDEGVDRRVVADVDVIKRFSLSPILNRNKLECLSR